MVERGRGLTSATHEANAGKKSQERCLKAGQRKELDPCMGAQCTSRAQQTAPSPTQTECPPG